MHPREILMQQFELAGCLRSDPWLSLDQHLLLLSQGLPKLFVCMSNPVFTLLLL